MLHIIQYGGIIPKRSGSLTLAESPNVTSQVIEETGVNIMTNSLKNHLSIFSVLLVTFSFLVTIIIPVAQVQAATPNTTTAVAKVSLTFDDGLSSAYTNAAPILSKYGFTGTEYVPTSCIGTTNFCPENPKASYMKWSQVQDLQNKYMWEIGSHSVDAPCLASNTPGCPNTSVLTPDQVVSELVNSKKALADQGITANAFASPYGDYNNSVLAQIAKYYTSHRGFADVGYNSFPYNADLLYDQQVQGSVSVAQVESYINHAKINNQWLVLTFHAIVPKPSTNPRDYQWGSSQLDQVAAYLKGQNTPVVNVSQGLASGVNMLTNSTFNDGIADGWTTDSPTSIFKNTDNNGSYPDSANSIELGSISNNAHLFSPLVSVDPQQTYFIKSFLNMHNISSGLIGYYIDEYDANGNWVSGQWKKQEVNAFVEEMNFEYKPSSLSVASARLQVVATANSGIHAYIDNVGWYSENLATTQPINLMPNSTFDNGISDGWLTDDSANIVMDSNNNGSAPSPLNSIKLQSGLTSANGHLFSPKIGVTGSSNYQINSYLNLKTINGGVFAYYIDEYDASGNWISGQYKTDRSVPFNGTVSFGYKPSSINVKSASLQFIVTGNSGILAYVDNVNWYQQ